MWQFIALIVVGLLQITVGFAGIEYHFGGFWAFAAVVAALWLRFLLPVTIGSYFGAVDVMGWEWYVGVAIAAPGLLFVVPSMVMVALEGIKGLAGEPNGNDSQPQHHQKASPVSADQAYEYIPRHKSALPASFNQSADVEIYSQPLLIGDDKVPKASKAKTVANLDQPTNDDDVSLSSFPKAQMAMEYRPEVTGAWEETKALPVSFQRRFLERLQSDPRSDAPSLAALLGQEFRKQQRPYDDEAANDALEDVRTISNEATIEFAKVYEAFGNTILLADILERIEAKYGPTERMILREEQEKLKQQQLKIEEEKQRKIEEQKLQQLEEERCRQIEEVKQLEREQKWVARIEKKRLEAERMNAEQLEYEQKYAARIVKKKIQHHRIFANILRAIDLRNGWFGYLFLKIRGVLYLIFGNVFGLVAITLISMIFIGVFK
ncbi:MAG: hypothetical protein ACMUJK_14895 [Rhodobacterales bacterium]